MLQLAGPQIKVVTSGHRFSDRVLYDQAAIMERFGLQPHQLVDLKGLVVDTSDNIPGVQGIGEKTAVKLLQEYGTLDEIYQHLAGLPEALRQKLEEGQENAFLSRDLGRIITDVPGLELDIQQGALADINLINLAQLLGELEFNSLMERIPGVSAETLKSAQVAKGPMSPDGAYRLADTPHKFAKLLARLEQAQVLAIDTETDSTDEMTATLVGIAVTSVPGEG